MATHIETLKAELDADPLARGYSTMTNPEIVVSMNTQDRDKNLDSITGVQLGDAVDEGEFNALTSDQKALVVAVYQLQSMNPFGFIESVIKDVFPQPGVTLAALSALRVGVTSRAGELGYPGRVREGHVELAKKL